MTQKTVHNFAREEILATLIAIARIRKSAIDFALETHGYNHMERPLWDIAYSAYYRGQILSLKQQNYCLRLLNTAKYAPIAPIIREKTLFMEPQAA